MQLFAHEYLERATARAESVICAEDGGVLGVLSHEKYKEILQNACDGISYEVKTLEAFATEQMHVRSVLKLCRDLKEVRLKREQILFREGETAKFMFLLKEGEIET